MGTGIGDVKWVEIEIRVNNPRKRPELHLHGAAIEIAGQLDVTEWDISLTHSQAYAMAMVVAV